MYRKVAVIGLDGMARAKIPFKLHGFLLRHPFLKSVIKNSTKTYQQGTCREKTRYRPFSFKSIFAFKYITSIYVKDQIILNHVISELEKIKYIKEVYRREKISISHILAKALKF